MPNNPALDPGSMSEGSTYRIDPAPCRHRARCAANSGLTRCDNGYRPDMYLDNEQISVYQARLLELRQEHRDLDDAITRLSEAPYINPMQLKRMKKRKLQLRDAIARLESLLIPDEPA